MTQAANSALYSARLRFVEGLPARADELSSTAERLARDPGDQEAAAMLRRRLHALLASAQVFEERALALAVQDLIARLDVAQRAERPFSRQEIDAVSLVVASLPTYVRPSLQPAAAESDVRELRGDLPEPAPIRPAAEGGGGAPEPPADRSPGLTSEPPAPRVVEPVVVAPFDSEPDTDNYFPASLSKSTSPAANDLTAAAGKEVDSEAGLGASGRSVSPRARRIIALSALQPGPGGLSDSRDPEPVSERPTRLAVPVAADLAIHDRPTVEALQPVSLDAEVPSMRPLPVSLRDSYPGGVERAEAALFAGERHEPRTRVEAVSDRLRTLAMASSEPGEPAKLAVSGDESWSRAVAEVGEELAAWRESLQPNPIPEIDIEDDNSEGSTGSRALEGGEAGAPEPSLVAENLDGFDVDTSTFAAVPAAGAAASPGGAASDAVRPLTAAEPGAEADAPGERSAATAVTKLRRPAKYGRPQSDAVATPAEKPNEDRVENAAAGAITKLRRPARSSARAPAVDTDGYTSRREDDARRPQSSHVDVVADAGRAGFGGGASALETLDVHSPSDPGSPAPVELPVTESSSGLEWLEPNRLASTGTSLAGDLAELGASLERNAISAAVGGAAPAADLSHPPRAAHEPASTTATGVAAQPAGDDPITLDMRPSDMFADWAESRTETHARSQSLPMSSDDDTAVERGRETNAFDDPVEPESRILPIAAAAGAPLEPAAGRTSPTIAVTSDHDDAERDSSATTSLASEPTLFTAAAVSPNAEPVDGSDADRDSSATIEAKPEPRSRISDWYAIASMTPPPTQATAAASGADFVAPSFDDETAPGFGPLVLLDQTVSGLLPAPRPVRLLLVADAACAARVNTALCADAYAVLHVASVDEALQHLHEAKPDLVLVSAELASLPDVDLVRRLKTDALTRVEQVHVLLPEGASFDQAFLAQISADGAVGEPLSDAALAPLLRQSSPAGAGEQPPVREGSIDDIAAQIADEIRRGIAESLRAGKHESARVGDGSQLMAAAWSAVGRVRSKLADPDRARAPSGETQPTTSLLPPAETFAAERTPSVHPSQLLAGHRVLVADDDPAVLWFFVGLLREASAQVLQAHNGREALELARRKQPHVIVSDILMPKLDGFGLCRELKRDALLSHVPVILLSWKDDLLQRMRELDAGAAGYLRKEAGSQQILAQLTDVLQPRTWLVAKLRGHADVNGSVAELGALSMLELVAAERPDARIIVRDALNLFEVDIRGGRRLSVTGTAADGAFTRGEKALMQLLGLARGEFQVTTSGAPIKAPISEPLDRALAAAGRRLSAIVDAVSDARLLRVCLIAFDDEVLQSLLSSPSTRLHEVVALFRTGNATAEGVLREGRFAPGELEDYLRELARCVAITGVWDSNGEDLVAAAQRERETPQLALLSSTLPPRSGSGSWSLAPEKHAAPRRRSESPILYLTPEVSTAAESAAAASPRSSAPPAIIASSSVAFTTIDSDLDAPALEPERVTAATHTAAESDTVPETAPPSAALAKIQTQPGIGPESKPPALPAWLMPQAALANSSSLRHVAESPLITPAPRSGISGMALSSGSAAPPRPDELETDAISKAELESFDLPVPSVFARAIPDRSEGLRLAGTLIVLAGVGYFGWQQFILTPERPQPAQTRVEASTKPVETAPAQPAAQAPVNPAEPEPKPQPAQPTIQNTQVGKVLPFVDASRGVVVAPDQGLLVIEFQGGSDSLPYIRVGSRELGKPPIAVALPAGRHELVVRTGKSTSFRYLIVRAGETRIVSVPLAEL